MGIFKKLIDLFVALLKLGFVYVLYFFDFIHIKYFYSPVKKPQESKPKIKDTGYVSIRDMTETEESRWRQNFMSKEYDFSEYAEINEYTLKQNKI